MYLPTLINIYVIINWCSKMSVSIRKIIAEEIDKVIREERTEYGDGTVEVDNFEYAYESMQFKKPGIHYITCKL